jgi:hypothetical protein
MNALTGDSSIKTMEKFMEKLSVIIQKRRRGTLDTPTGDASPRSDLAQ